MTESLKENSQEPSASTYGIKSLFALTSLCAVYFVCFLQGGEGGVVTSFILTLAIVAYVICSAPRRFREAFVQMFVCLAICMLLVHQFQIPYLSGVFVSPMPPSITPWGGEDFDLVLVENNRRGCLAFVVLALVPFMTALIACPFRSARES